jgi:hypothetical protein
MRKNRPVLYEVLRRKGPSTPWRPRVSRAAPPETTAAAPADEGFSTLDESPPLVTVAAGRIYLVFGFPIALLILGSLLALSAVLVHVGWRMGQRDLAEEARHVAPALNGLREASEPSAESGSPNRGRETSPGIAIPDKRAFDAAVPAAKGTVQPAAQPPGESAAPAQKVKLDKGMWYVFVQHFSLKDGDDARKAYEFLESNGIACARLTGKDIRLLAVEPFDIGNKDRAIATRERARANELIKRIKDLGKQYFKTGGYDFTWADVKAP